jgi:hypothetical protein
MLTYLSRATEAPERHVSPWRRAHFLYKANPRGSLCSIVCVAGPLVSIVSRRMFSPACSSAGKLEHRRIAIGMHEIHERAQKARKSADSKSCSWGAPDA